MSERITIRREYGRATVYINGLAQVSEIGIAMPPVEKLRGELGGVSFRGPNRRGGANKQDQAEIRAALRRIRGF